MCLLVHEVHCYANWFVGCLCAYLSTMVVGRGMCHFDGMYTCYIVGISLGWRCLFTVVT